MADPSPTAHDPTPVVERAGTGNVGLILFVIALVVGGAWIFSVMNTARQQAQISPLEASGQKNHSAEQTREAQKIGSQILQTDINFRNIKDRMDKIRRQVEKLEER